MSLRRSGLLLRLSLSCPTTPQVHRLVHVPLPTHDCHQHRLFSKQNISCIVHADNLVFLDDHTVLAFHGVNSLEDLGWRICSERLDESVLVCNDAALRDRSDELNLETTADWKLTASVMAFLACSKTESGVLSG